MDRATTALVDGLGVAAATSGILSQLQARIFALLYMHDAPLSLDAIAGELQQSKSNISINIRVLVEWHLVRRSPVPGSRKDHYEAASDFFRAMQEIFERRFRWTVRQVLAAVGEARELRPLPRASREKLERLEAFFSLMDAGIGAFVRGQPFPANQLRNVVRLPRRRAGSPPG